VLKFQGFAIRELAIPYKSLLKYRILAICLDECNNIKGDICKCVIFTVDFLLLVCVKCIKFYSLVTNDYNTVYFLCD